MAISSSSCNSYPPKQWWTITATVISTGAVTLGIYSYYQRGEETSSIHLFRKWKRYLLSSLRKDFPLWVGSGWLLLRKPSSSSSASLPLRVLDFLTIGLLLTYRESTSGNDEPGNNDSCNTPASDQERVDSLKQQIPPSLSNELIEPPRTKPLLDNKKSRNGQRYIELMVHNVSHTDLVLSLDAPPASSSYVDLFCLCRPRFSAFDFYSKKVANVMTILDSSALVRFPRYERSDATRRYQIKPEPNQNAQQPPIGFAMPDDQSLHVTTEELNDLRVRGRDASRLTNITATKLNAVLFPLLATLMPQWQASIRQKYDNHTLPKQVLILVSGVGTPRNWTHSITGNSTQVCAQLMQHYLQTLYPHLVVVQIHSETNIFRYDENISFVQNELMPCIQSYRDAHAKGLPYPDEKASSMNSPTISSSDMEKISFMADWKKSFKITLSFADGSPARNHAIQAALRPYRPAYYHCWQLKTFWHESKIVDADIEVHSFEDMETLPALSTDQLQDKPVVMQVVDEIKAFSNEMAKVLADGDHDIRKFWLRKTQKPVLAVLAVQLDSGRIKLYRGTNMEVSMPTGSLCAERNVIGTALADNPALKRHDLKVIAVLSVPSPSKPDVVSLSNSLASCNSLPSLMADTDYSESPKLIPSSADMMQDEGWLLQDLTGAKPRLPASVSASPAMNASKTPPLHPNTTATASMPPSFALGPSAAATPPSPSTPARRIHVHSSFDKRQLKASRSRKTTVVVHSNEDLNPLRPCGACNEWLKKIAESNPYFQILTFTDAECNGVYCTPCEE